MVRTINMIRQRKQPETGAEPDAQERRNRAVAVGLDVARLGSAGFERAGFADPTLVLRWNEIVGPEIARFAQPLRMTEGPSGGVLTLKADPAASVFLQHESRALCSRINSYLGRLAVQRLRFVAGNMKPKLPVSHGPTKSDPAPEDVLSQFGGQEHLRRALLALARARTRNGPSAKD
jgi:hypothetical protein